MIWPSRKWGYAALPVMTTHRWILLALLAFGIMAVVSSLSSLSETSDELFHISCGMQWWQEGIYTIQPLHPPMARVMDASLVYFHDSIFGIKTLPKRDGYILKMVLSRLGGLPYYVFSCVLVFVWARKLFGEASALWSLGLYVTLSTVTAHGMLATTDMGYTAMLLWALFVTVLWLENPTQRRSFWLGVSLAFMVGTKFSGLLHWPLALSVILLAQIIGNHQKALPLSPLRRVHFYNGFVVTLPCFVFVLWLVYRCDFSSLFLGIESVMHLNKVGFGVWFYGPLNNKAVWSFFPVVFFFKTPLGFLASAMAGCGFAAWGLKRNQLSATVFFPLFIAIIILLSSMTSNINLGVRHVLPLYPLLAIPAGYGLWTLWTAKGWRRFVALMLALSHYVGFCMFQPEHLAYFNIAAGEHPERITLDSDYDWGQAMIMLDEQVKERGIREVSLCARKDALWSAGFVVGAKILPCPKHPATGWIAVARAWRLLNPDNFTWLDGVQEVEKIGKTMDLYYIAPRKPIPNPLLQKPVPIRPKANLPEDSVKLPAEFALPPQKPLPMTPAPRSKPSLVYPLSKP